MAAKQIKLSNPSFMWALMIFLGAHHLFEKDNDRGFLSWLLSLPLLIVAWPFRAYYAYMYWQFEGVYFLPKTGEILVKNLDEPEGIGDLVKLVTSWGGRQLVPTKKMAAADVNSFESAKLFMGWMTLFTCGAAKGQNLLTITIADPRRTEKKIRTYAEKFAKEKSERGWQSEILKQARRELEVEEMKGKLKAEKGESA